MCGRYIIDVNRDMVRLIRQFGVDMDMPSRWSLVPTQTAPVLWLDPEAPHDSVAQYQLKDMRWWLVPPWSDGPANTKFSLFNARSETLTSSRAFAESFRRRRCLVPASAFLEWRPKDKRKHPYRLNPVSGAMFFAGLWDYWRQGDEALFSFTIITTAAVPALQDLHHRMPVMFDADEGHHWLNPQADPLALQSMLQPHLPCPLSVQRLDNRVNKVASVRGADDLIAVEEDYLVLA